MCFRLGGNSKQGVLRGKRAHGPTSEIEINFKPFYFYSVHQP